MQIRGSTGILGSAPPGRSCPSPGLPPALGARRSENRGDLVGCKGREVSPRAGRCSYATAPGSEAFVLKIAPPINPPIAPNRMLMPTPTRSISTEAGPVGISPILASGGRYAA